MHADPTRKAGMAAGSTAGRPHRNCSRRGFGKRVRRRRRVTACISWLLIALMTVGPERVYALSVEAQAHAAYAKAVAAGVLAQAVPGRFDWSYDYDDNGNLESTTKSDSAGTVVQADGYTYDGERRLACPLRRRR